MSADGDRLHVARTAAFEALFAVAAGASFERRVGHARLLFPDAPIATFNGVMVVSEPCEGITDTIREVESAGVQCGVHLRPDIHDAVARQAKELGLVDSSPLPGMAARPAELAPVTAPKLDIVRATTAAHFAEAEDVSQVVFQTPAGARRALYDAIRALDGCEVWIGRVDGEPVTTATAHRIGRDVGIFNVATPERHRRRGYGAAVTAQAARAAFDDGADFAWLQTSTIGESVYRQLGFRHVVEHALLTRPRT